MKSPIRFTLGLILMSAAAAGLVGPLYAESAESCGSLLFPEATSFCSEYEQRRWFVLTALVASALALMLAGRRPTSHGTLGPRQRNGFVGAGAGLLTLPIALVLLSPLFFLNQVLHGFTQAFTGVPYIFAPAALALGALVAARIAARAGADEGVALAAAAAGLPLMLSVQAVAEAFRWRLDAIPTPLRLSGTFAHNQPDDVATFVTYLLASIPMCLALGMAARSRRRMPPHLGAGLLGFAALAGSVLFAATDDGGVYSAASVRWLPVVLLPAGLALVAIARCRPEVARKDTLLASR